ncbi:hypothetical protein GQ53DRAFT_646018, partial [Thozetella sp. PMI_491]
MADPSISTKQRPRPTVANEDSFREQLYWEESDENSGETTVVRRTSAGPPAHPDQPTLGRPSVSRQPVHRQSSQIPHPETESVDGEFPERGVSSARNERSRRPSTLQKRAEYDILYTSADSKDVSVRLELDLHHDIDDEMEEFNRFVCLGDFRNAKCFFDEHLGAHMNNPLVFVQYAEMLLEMGDFKSIMLLDPDPAFSCLEGIETNQIPGGLEALRWNWRLIKAVTLSHIQHEMQPVMAEYELMMRNFPKSTAESSTEIRVVSLILSLLLHMGIPTIVTQDFLNDEDWELVYQGMLTEGRIWDFKNLFTSVTGHAGFDQAVEVFFGSRDAVEAILTDWKTTENDDSTQLALLSILSLMTLDCLTSPETQKYAERCLRAANAIGESVLQRFPQHVKTRPFLQWVVARSATSARKEDTGSLAFEYLEYYPGEAVLPTNLDIPFYIPIGQENPGWTPPELEEESSEPLETALNAAIQLEDYETQAVLLQQLIVRSKHPGALFQKLANLQKSVQNNRTGYLKTCLSMYLLSKDKASKKELRAELAEFDWDDDPKNLMNPVHAATRDILLRALSENAAQYPPNSIRAALKYYESLPNFFQDLIDHNEPPQFKP